MNKFQRKIIKKNPMIEYNDFLYFTSKTENKIIAMGLPKKECSINNIFIGCNEEGYERRSYCLKNCGLKCLNGNVIRKEK